MREFVRCAIVACVASLLIQREAVAVQFLIGSASGSASVSVVNNAGATSGGALDLIEFDTPILPATSTVETIDDGWIVNDAGSNALAGYSLFGKVGTIRSSAFAECYANADLPGQPGLKNFARSTAEASVSWGDDMVVTSPTGDPVVIAARVVVHADCGFTTDTTSNTNNYLRYMYRLPGVSATQTTELTNVQGEYLFDQTFILSVNPGAYFIANSLRIEASAEARINESNPAWKDEAFSRIDSTHTMSIFFDVVSGGDYSMASGADLRSVPAPGVCGIALWMVLPRRQRSA